MIYDSRLWAAVFDLVDASIQHVNEAQHKTVSNIDQSQNSTPLPHRCKSHD